MRKSKSILALFLAALMALSVLGTGAVSALAFNPNNYKPDFTQLKIGAPITGTDGKKYLPVTCFFTSSEDLSDKNTVECLEANVSATLANGAKAEGVKGNGQTLYGPLNLGEYNQAGANAFMWSWNEGNGAGEVKFNLPLLENNETQSVEKSQATGLEEVNGLKVGDKVEMQLVTEFKNNIPAEVLPGGSHELPGNKATFTVEESSKYPKTVDIGSETPEPETPSTPSTPAAPVKRLNNPIFVVAKKVTIKSKKLKKKKKVTVSAKKAFVMQNAQGKVTYKKLKGNKKISINKDGKITVKKGIKKGKYTVWVRVSVAGNNGYYPADKNVKCTIVVK